MSVEFVEDLKKQWMAMIDAIGDPLVILDGEFNVLRQNRAYFETALQRGELSIREMGGKKCYEVFAGRTTPCKHCKLQKASQANTSERWHTGNLIPEREFEIRVHPLPNEGMSAPTERPLLVVHYRDVTQLRSMQEELARADKLGALGKLAGGVAHEINSPLAGILAFAQMALREMEVANPHKQDMQEIEDAAKKCKTIVEGLLGFARQDKPTETAQVDILAALRSTLRLVSPMLKRSQIDLVLEISDSEKTLVDGNSGKLCQVFLNLATNAIYAMKEGGGVLQVRATVDSHAVRIAFEDSGIGIDPTILGRVFDPFFTTKPVGEGTGLGLSISYSIIKQHGGDITVVSQPGLGTTFLVTLPINTNPRIES